MSGSVVKACACRQGDELVVGARCNSCNREVAWKAVTRLPDGRRWSKRARTKREAERALAAVVRKVDARVSVDPKETTSVYLEAWRREIGRRLRPTTLRAYDSALAELGPLIGHVRLEDLRHEHCEAVVQHLLDTGRGAPTIRKVFAVLRSALSDAVEQRRLPFNPAEQVRAPRYKAPRVQPWSAIELGRFLDAAAHDRYGPLFELAALTGMRRGELAGLRWVDVDEQRSRLTVREQVTDVGGRLHVGPPKTDAGERVVTLPEQVVGALLAWRLTQAADRDQWGAAWHDSGLVFTREDGHGLRPEFISRRAKAIGERADLPPKRLHDLRHGTASLLLAAGVPLAVTSKLIGHSQTSITADLYSHLLDGVDRQAVEAAATLVPRAAGTTVTPQAPQERDRGSVREDEPAGQALEPPNGIEPLTCSLRERRQSSDTAPEPSGGSGSPGEPVR